MAKDGFEMHYEDAEPVLLGDGIIVPGVGYGKVTGFLPETGQLQVTFGLYQGTPYIGEVQHFPSEREAKAAFESVDEPNDRGEEASEQCLNGFKSLPGPSEYTSEPWDHSPVISRDGPSLRTSWGVLYEGDCLSVLKDLKDASVDTVFADPPFNLGKLYGSKVNDDRPDGEYIQWCHRWIDECVRALKPGGAFFLYNIPKWNVLLGAYLQEHHSMTFKHWIAVSMKLSLPLPGRLYPAHYSLLYYTKGKQKTFRRIRTPIELCRHCGKEIKDYGGHRGAMNPIGVNLTDVWTDISPVRHWKFKSKKRSANALSTKILDRVIEMSTEPGDVVVDPFGGSGTTYDVCERKRRHWVGMDLESCDVIAERMNSPELHYHHNTDVLDLTKAQETSSS